ncbi:hypothetical protein H6P81_001788 [Aristolochia fimbriata]|uniref:Uncharacterized protein n=1 Tax=Aristolochia fimbriata TaxID=158543 RepID=A0AAV7F7W9_ARIFI|nr:hypothetical protein H6P81_001788 [Aristolochia fimbriata]
MRASAVQKIERKSSIESEPRTLHFDQIEYAREAALYILNTNSIEEALKIFTEGLQPVATARAEEAAAAEAEEDQWERHAGYLRHPPLAGGGRRDVLTAPF